MISNITGNYSGMCSNGVTSPNRVGSTVNDSKMRKIEQLDEINQCFNKSPQQIPMNTVAKIAENAADKESIAQTTNLEPDNIASLISFIESSRKIGNNFGTTMPQLFSSLPASQGQLTLMSTNVSNTTKDGLVTELVQNFSKIDTNKDNLVSYNEVLAFLNQY